MGKPNPGKLFETYLDQYHQILRMEGKALITKVPEPVQILLRAGRTKTQLDGLCRSYRVAATRAVFGRLEEARWTDFTGVIEGGLALALEAKATTQSRFHPSYLRDSQLKVLEQVHSLEGIAFVLVRHAVVPSGADYLVRWPELVATGFKPMPFAKLTKVTERGWYEHLQVREFDMWWDEV